MLRNPPPSAGGMKDAGSVPDLGRSAGGGHGNPLQYSCLQDHMDRGACRLKSIGLQRVRYDRRNFTRMQGTRQGSSLAAQ